jgi:hypothetical protein
LVPSSIVTSDNHFLGCCCVCYRVIPSDRFNLAGGRRGLSSTIKEKKNVNEKKKKKKFLNHNDHDSNNNNNIYEKKTSK